MFDHWCSLSGQIIRTPLLPGRQCGPTFCDYVRYDTWIYIQQQQKVNFPAWRCAVPV